MKIYYKRLSKEDRKKARKEYFSTESGKIFNKYLKISSICFIIAFFYGIFYMYEYFFKKNSIFNLIYSILLIITSICFLVFYKNIKTKKVNSYLLKNKK